MSRYAEKTCVSSERSRAEIERILSKYGATAFAYGWEGDRAMVGFRLGERQVRFIVPMPDKEDPIFHRTPTGRTRRNPYAATEAWEQATRQRWRALSLVVKAKLEAVDSGIGTFDEEFLAHIVLPNGQTVGDWSLPQIEVAYRNGRMPRLLEMTEAGSP